ncbi:aminotransferase-like domain-containing protein [Paracraurococcus ruber]|uniref:GntR family transcriptional regulator n=1 Tax=Paracraurococcus ruber TaxID=77675 RepID=A0ABS1CSB2_9PROT|nr:PLP-dependent aminotransferase family protein [Paracraurococcus ruber]MBK1656882.1 GntR family transcriptional regulator [Paracraurococcus ruber]TDG33322.1 PLP-dependent aminotransferase family protein [Paracraurococcus ruber]
MTDWVPSLEGGSKARYIAIAEAIQSDVSDGRLAPAQRLPAQRHLARLLGLDFTTVARGYAEAQRRGLIESRVGEGTFVAGAPVASAGSGGRVEAGDFSMNMPPEPADAALWKRLGSGLDPIAHDLARALRYQRVGGTESERQAAIEWLARRGVQTGLDRVFVVPGAHAALFSAMTVLSGAERGQVLTEALTYPGVKGIAEQLGVELIGLPADAQGLLPDALDKACRRRQPKILYLNPTLSNPTTHTIPLERRQEIAAVARMHGVAILEDDPYGMLSADVPPAFASVAPDLTWHVATLSKCLGAGLRIAYVVVPDARSGWNFTAAVRTANVMVSPITATLATRWIKDGTADALLSAIRAESRERQVLVAALLPGELVTTDPAAFHLWLTMPSRWSRSAFVAHMASSGLGVVASDVFGTGGALPEAVRVGLGGPAPRSVVRTALEFAAHALAESPARASGFL